jgi:8-oxo-dGTP diphosphatase
MEVDSDPGFVPNDEVDELRWLKPAQANALLTYERDRDVLAAASL